MFLFWTDIFPPTSVQNKKYPPKIMAELTNNIESFQLSKELNNLLFGKSENKWDSNQFFQSVKKSRNTFLEIGERE
jgi:hypothetical protein